MRKPLLFVALLVLLVPACSHFDIVQYQPNPNDNHPQKTIERILKEQPPSWGDVPHSVKVQDDRIEMWLVQESGMPGLKFSSSEVSKVIYFKHIGKTVLHKHGSGVWYVEILDPLGQWMHSVNCYEVADAKAFIDALYTMKASLR
ncbi:MAG: hypothetical protein CVU64_03180 [Deltaproteobacteria bacterium HGW-Deltaproteobacteria-21]|jgi:hypothetical protein|nr:MAG: hypothetical protein CVU64_03180 [Deltaproteobacteria bacterium HGW-Deltaproteobacteria-21]